MSGSNLKLSTRTEAEYRARKCPPHNEAQKFGADGKTLYIVCEACGETLRRVPDGLYYDGMQAP